MISPPKWYLPTAVAALLWNVVGCVAYLADVTLSPEDIAAMSASDQALYAARPVWAVAATAIAVWGGAVGSLGLTLRKRWATPVLVASLAGIVVQDVGLFVVSGVGREVGAAVYVLQGMVLVIGVGLVLLSRRARAAGWIA